MPRPDKPIEQGSLDKPSSSSRAHSWTKYGGPETVEGHRGAPSSTDPAVIEVAVDDITVANYPDEIESKYTTRGASAHGAGLPAEEVTAKRVEFVNEWVINRTVEDRTYHRIDTLVKVQIET